MSTPTMPNAVRRSIDARLREVNTCIPARVEAFDRSNRTITAQPLVKVAYTDETGARQTEALPPVTHVPVCYPHVAGRGMTFPLVAGDTVLLMIAQASIDRWFALGGLVDPEDDRHHALSDAFAIPGVMADPDAEEVHATATVISGDEIHAGGTQALALNADLEALRSALAALTTGPTAPVGTAASTGVTGLGRTIPFDGTTVLKGG